ncbi:MAG: hypothetical protein HY855_13625 [Burkholderiales bacterium]|nr:hypothetical protein [Burkholderiales bacterium]
MRYPLTTILWRWLAPWLLLAVLAGLVALAVMGPAAAAAPDPAASPLAAARTQQVFGAVQALPEGGWSMRQDKRLRLPGTSAVRAELPAGTWLRLSAALGVRERGQAHEVLLWDGERPDDAAAGGFLREVSVLAVFRPGEVAPIDVAEVKTDRLTFFAQRAVVALGTADDAFVLVNHHANAGQPYTEHSLYHLRQGRLRRIVQVDLLGEMSGCARAFDQTVHWEVVPDPAAPLPRITARVDLTHAPAAVTGDCRPRPTPRRVTYADPYRWDSSHDRYVREPGGTLERLVRWNDTNR